MNRTWTVCRQYSPRPDGERRRDQACQLLVRQARQGGLPGLTLIAEEDADASGVLALIHPVDQAPKALLLNRAIPCLNRLLNDYNASLPHNSRPQRQLRVRAVVHAGEVHYDANGCFGEALDVAFRLLDASRVKRALREAADPLILVISGDIYRSVVRHGYDGIDQRTFHPLVRVQIADNRYRGWIRIPEQTTQHQVTKIASFRRPALHIGDMAVCA
jgi:hypothetical protein